MGLADNFGKMVGNESPDVAPVGYRFSQYSQDGDYERAQLQANQGMRAGQSGLANAAGLYASAAAGNQPSVAQQQLVAGQQAAAMQANQMAASARGGAGAGIMAQRQAMDQQAAGAAGASQQAAMLRAHEMEQARAGLAGVGAQQQGLGQQYGIARQGQDIQERGLQLQAEQGTQGVQSANDIARLKQNGGLLGGIMGMAAGAAGAAAA